MLFFIEFNSIQFVFFFFSSRRRHTRCGRDWSSDVCSSDLKRAGDLMAWPLTPLLTFIDGSSPPCNAAFLNSVQSGVTGIVAATYSLAGVVVDGTGGNVVTPTDGAVKVSASGAGSSTPTPTTALATFYKESVPSMWARVTFNASGGTLLEGLNVFAVVRSGVGVYQVEL